MPALFAVAYTEKALASLRAISSRKVRGQIKAKVDGLARDPHPAGVVKVQGVMNGKHSVFRLRSGDYRVLFCPHGDNEILVLDIGDRKDVYRSR